MKIVAFTPIRLNSKRLPGKSIIDLNGIPLLNYQLNVVQGMQRRGSIHENYVFCSNLSIREHIQMHLSDVEIAARPVYLDSDNTLGNDIYKEFIKRVPADIYVLYHVTSPLLRLEHYLEGLAAMARPEYDAAMTVQRVQQFAWYKDQPLNYDPMEPPRTQDLEPVFVETSGFFMFSREAFEKHGRTGSCPHRVEVDSAAAIDIDNQHELDLCAFILKGGYRLI